MRIPLLTHPLGPIDFVCKPIKHLNKTVKVFSLSKKLTTCVKINIDPKLRLAALNSISDGSSYFKNRLNDIEKSIDSNRINIDSIENDQLIHLKNYLDANLDSELQSSDKDTSYLLNIFNLFYNQQWNILLDKLLSYIFKYCIETGFDINRDFLIELYEQSSCDNKLKKNF